MRVAYVYEGVGTSLHRAAAIERCGHTVGTFRSKKLQGLGRLAARFHWQTGGTWIGKSVSDELWAEIGKDKWDVLWVDQGRYVSRHLLDRARAVGTKTVLLNQDDPYGTRDGNSWALFRKTLRAYDLAVVFREPNIGEAKALGAPDVMRVWFGCDEVAHAPRQFAESDLAGFRSDVLFLGTWFPERGPLLLALADKGIEPTIVGARWDKAPEWPQLQRFHRGGATKSDDEYAKWIQGAKICIGLVSKGNRDEHTTRSMEIPALGSLLCAERTGDHMRLYEDGSEAIFWDDVDECATRCAALLAEPGRIARISAAGHARMLANHVGNQDMASAILARLGFE